jgi:guanosine-3',5'-bis(diphosphate) 3'-pyrophosphohydrolase
METLHEIENFARQAHEGQERKYESGPYIIHPMRVMDICGKYTQDKNVLAAALLHDVLEDTPVTEEQLNRFLSSVMPSEDARLVLLYVIELTDVYTKNNFPEWNRRKRKMKETQRLSVASPGAQTIKYADIIDNSHSIVNTDTDFAEKYLYECRSLLKEMKQGELRLRNKAIETVNECLERLKVEHA